MTEEQLRNILNQELTKFAGQLFKYVDRRFGEVSRDVARVRQEVAKVYDRLDEIVTDQEVERQERAAMNIQLDRHEGWIHQLGDKTDVKLDYQADQGM